MTFKMADNDHELGTCKMHRLNLKGGSMEAQVGALQKKLNNFILLSMLLRDKARLTPPPPP